MSDTLLIILSLTHSPVPSQQAAPPKSRVSKIGLWMYTRHYLESSYIQYYTNNEYNKLLLAVRKYVHTIDICCAFIVKLVEN